MHARTRSSIFEQFEPLPEGLTGKILDGRLDAHTRPSAPHVPAAPSLAGELVSPFRKGRGAPAGSAGEYRHFCLDRTHGLNIHLAPEPNTEEIAP